MFNCTSRADTCVEDASSAAWHFSCSARLPDADLTLPVPACKAGSTAISTLGSVVVAGTKMVHVGKNTRSRIVSKGISAGRSQNAYRGLVQVRPAAQSKHRTAPCRPARPEPCSGDILIDLNVQSCLRGGGEGKLIWRAERWPCTKSAGSADGDGRPELLAMRLDAHRRHGGRQHLPLHLGEPHHLLPASVCVRTVCNPAALACRSSRRH